MGTICFPTDKTAGAILHDELCGGGDKTAIRMFTTNHDSAAVALSVDLTKVNDQWRDFILSTYDLPPNAQRAIVAVIVKHEGLNGRGRRNVCLKVMSEEMWPYYTGGATRQLLSILSPLRSGACPDAEEWRRTAWEDADNALAS